MDAAEKLLLRLRERYVGLDGAALLRPMIEREFPGAIALVSSFGAESAVLLALVAEIDPTVPVLFLDTGKLFGETLRYRDELSRHLGKPFPGPFRVDSVVANLESAAQRGRALQAEHGKS